MESSIKRLKLEPNTSDKLDIYPCLAYDSIVYSLIGIPPSLYDELYIYYPTINAQLEEKLKSAHFIIELSYFDKEKLKKIEGKSYGKDIKVCNMTAIGAWRPLFDKEALMEEDNKSTT